MIRQRIAAHLKRRHWHQKLRAAGLTRANINALEAHPRYLDVRFVLTAAQMGVRADHIADLVLTVQTRFIGRAEEALELVTRLHVWGIPYDHAATLVADIARAAGFHATEGA